MSKTNNKKLDVDFAIYGNIEHFSERLGNHLGDKIQHTKQFNAYHIENDDYSIDITHARKENYPNSGDLPLYENSNIMTDLKRRDISINSIAVEIGKDEYIIIDPYNGIKDINDKLIRINHHNSFKDDPTRIFRCIKFASRLNFQFEKKSLNLLKKSSKYLKNISNYRKNNELKKIIQNEPIKEFFVFINKFNFTNFFPKNFINKISMIEEKFWDESTIEEKIYFSFFEDDLDSKLLFVTDLGLSKESKEKIISIEKTKERILNDELIVENEQKLISNLYHCL
jgi:tRNA nucleotidyltransferase/poly(A) polymerase